MDIFFLLETASLPRLLHLSASGGWPGLPVTSVVLEVLGQGEGMAWYPLSLQRAFNATSFLRHIRKLGHSPEGEEASERRMARHSHPGLRAGQSPNW